MSRARNRFQLKAGNTWEIHTVRGKPRIVIDRHFNSWKHPISPTKCLSTARVRELVAWLNRYLGMVAPTEASEAAAQARAHARGVERAITTLETKL